MPLLVFAHFEDRYDTYLFQLGRRLDFALEALDLGIIGQLATENPLQGHVSI
jgi:hypothetical protein